MTAFTPADLSLMADAAPAVDHLRIAYTIQNVGLDLSRAVGDVVPVRNTLLGLQQAGHTAHVFELQGQTIAQIDDVTQLNAVNVAPTRITGTRPFRLTESFIRRVQRTLHLPYFAFFDSWRFYEVCLNRLPQYDLCHEHNGLFSPAAALACRRLNKPYVLTFSADSILELDLVGRPLRGLHRVIAQKEARLTYDQADQIICVSNAARKHLIDQWGVAADKINVMPNGVDVALFSRTFDATVVRAKWGIGRGPVVSFVGGFQPWHGLGNLVESFAAIWPNISEARLLLVGDGPYRAELEQKINEHGVAAATIITGLLPQDQVPELLSITDIAVIPYPQLPQELWFSPLKLYEYMAAGKAIVSSRAGQLAEVLEHGRTGLLVESGNIQALTQAIRSLIENPTERKRLGANARQQAIVHHSWEQYIRRLEQIYAQALA